MLNVQKYNHQFISTSYRCILSQSKSHNQRTLMYKCKRSTNFIYDFNVSYANKSDSSLSKWHKKKEQSIIEHWYEHAKCGPTFPSHALKC